MSRIDWRGSIGWLAPVLIGGMYMIHEMTNPEYWYGGMNYLLVFVGVTLTAAVYLWRRNIVSIWIADGVGRFLTSLWN
jgi:hypothetical protein